MGQSQHKEAPHLVPDTPALSVRAVAAPQWHINASLASPHTYVRIRIRACTRARRRVSNPRSRRQATPGPATTAEAPSTAAPTCVSSKSARLACSMAPVYYVVAPTALLQRRRAGVAWRAAATSGATQRLGCTGVCLCACVPTPNTPRTASRAVCRRVAVCPAFESSAIATHRMNPDTLAVSTAFKHHDVYIST